MKAKIVSSVTTVIAVLLALAMIVLYIYGIAVNGNTPTENLFRTLAVVFSMTALIIRINNGHARQSLTQYENVFRKEIGQAFINSPADRKALLKALRLYNEDQLDKATKALIKLQPKCQTDDEYRAVGLFLAICFNDMGIYKEAIGLYEYLISRSIVSPTIYSNLGQAYKSCGDFSQALKWYHRAVEADPSYAIGYSNIAHLYFEKYEMESAIEYAKKALEIDAKIRQAASLLAIIYTLLEQNEEAQRYTHIALANGQNAQALAGAIEHYRNRSGRSEEPESDEKDGED